MNDEPADDSGRLTSPNIELTAQQANLVRAVLAPQQTDFLSAPARDATTGAKVVDNLTRSEVKDFRSTWRKTPVASISVMNRAIADIGEPERAYRYVWAALELELLMDRRESPRAPGKELRGIPNYLMDGYTDLGPGSNNSKRRRRERILVDKERLRPQLLQTKRKAIEVFSKSPAPTVMFESLLRRTAQSLREDVGYDESRDDRAVAEHTVRLSECVENRCVDGRHLALLYQLRMQEAGIESRIVKGVLRLFGTETRHSWNVAWRDDVFALVDVTFATKSGLLVVTGNSPAEAYSKTMRCDRSYCPAPDSFNHYVVGKCD